MGRLGGLDRRELDELGDALSVLGSPTRLEILQALRVPKKASEVRVKANAGPEELPQDRMISRPAVVKHLKVLEAHELVRREDETGAYVVNQQMVFSLLQEVGQLARIRPVVEVDVEQTRDGPEPTRAEIPEEPRFLLVAGPREGDAFPLTGPGPWTVGRKPDTDVRLDFDPHVSRSQALVARTSEGFTVTPDPGSKNPVLVDFRPVPGGRETPLSEGSVLGVGLSRLVLQRPGSTD